MNSLFPPPGITWKRLPNPFPTSIIEISPESHDEEVRRAFGRPYDNESLERMIADAIDLGCKRIDLFFMTGLPKQTYPIGLGHRGLLPSPAGTISILQQTLPFISPLAPFLDPGSMVFEEPEKYGYRLLYGPWKNIARPCLAPSWKYILNYETEWMTRDEIVYSTYEAGKDSTA